MGVDGNGDIFFFFPQRKAGVAVCGGGKREFCGGMTIREEMTAGFWREFRCRLGDFSPFSLQEVKSVNILLFYFVTIFTFFPVEISVDYF